MEFARSDNFDGPNLLPLGRFAPSGPGHHVAISDIDPGMAGE
jgi:hypothetical protein